MVGSGFMSILSDPTHVGQFCPTFLIRRLDAASTLNDRQNNVVVSLDEKVNIPQ